MTEAVKNFLEVNYELLDTNQNEFFHIAYNGLSLSQQKELVTILSDAAIDVDDAIESFIRFHINMTFQTIERPVTLKIIIKRYFDGILGLDDKWLYDYIINNQAEWDNKIESINGAHFVFPVVDDV